MLPDDLPDNVVPLRPRQSRNNLAHSPTIKSPPPLRQGNLAQHLDGAQPEPRAAEPPAAKPEAIVPHEPQPAIASLTGPGASHGTPAPLTAAVSLPDADREVPMKPDPIETQPPRRFHWQTFLIALVLAFLLGIGMAWGAIAIGARIVDFWPSGFALYAMLVGGGLTMMLATGLMAAIFYSDSSGHDEDVYRFRPDKRQRTEKPERTLSRD